MDMSSEKLIDGYYAEMGRVALQPHGFLGALRVLFGDPARERVITNHHLSRLFARWRGYPNVVRPRNFECYEALRHAFRLLARKGVPVFEYRGVRLQDGCRLTPSERRRQKTNRGFPEMYRDPLRYEAEYRELLGDRFSPEYVRELADVPQTVQVGPLVANGDKRGPYLNVSGGVRFTPGQPGAYRRTIHVYGACTAFGYCCEDAETMPARLQAILNARGYEDVRVVNHGFWDANRRMIGESFLNDCISLGPNDIVLLHSFTFEDDDEAAFYPKLGVRVRDFSADWFAGRTAAMGFYNNPTHMNPAGAGYLAELIAEDLLSAGLKATPPDPEEMAKLDVTKVTAYLKSLRDPSFERDVKAYTDGILAEHPAGPEVKLKGAICMNANPFTYGHRRLVEYAAARVDRLYVIVLQAERSYFTFAQRFEAVREGCRDLANVIVLASGRFQGTAFANPEYFMKDCVKDPSFDASRDVDIFGEYIAKPLGITKRFCGEEPDDPVTATFNRSLAERLPRYGVEFVEIPRFTADDGRRISGTEVRRLVQEKRFDELKRLVPPATYEVITR